MSDYRNYSLDVTTSPAAGGYTARVAIRRRDRRQPTPTYLPPLGPKPTPEAAADHALRWAQEYLDENKR